MTLDSDVLLLLGEIKNGVTRLREDFAEEKALSKENRATIHRRLDEQAERIAKIEAAVAISASDVEELKGAFETHQAEIGPTIQEWRRMKVLGSGITGLLAIAGLSLGAFLTWAGDSAVTAIRAWLKIGG